jgi:hypothetical protein
LKVTLLGSLDASNPATYTASPAIELGSTPDHGEEILQVTYKNGNEKLYTLKTTRLYWTTLLAVHA